MTAVLSSCCGHCGRIDSEPAPAFADIPAASNAMAARGWTYDAKGRSCCSTACADALNAATAAGTPPAPRARAAAPPHAPDLFS